MRSREGLSGPRPFPWLLLSAYCLYVASFPFKAVSSHSKEILLHGDKKGVYRFWNCCLMVCSPVSCTINGYQQIRVGEKALQCGLGWEQGAGPGKTSQATQVFPVGPCFYVVIYVPRQWRALGALLDVPLDNKLPGSRVRVTAFKRLSQGGLTPKAQRGKEQASGWQTSTYRDAQVHTGGSASSAKPRANSKLILFPNEGRVPGGTPRLPPHSPFSTCVFFSFLRGFYFFLPLARAPWQFYAANSNRQQMLCTPWNNFIWRPHCGTNLSSWAPACCRGMDLPKSCWPQQEMFKCLVTVLGEAVKGTQDNEKPKEWGFGGELWTAVVL